MRSNIFITGFSGSGKTTVGRKAASRLGWRYVDLDDEIVGAAGKPIDAIFQEHGEDRFRTLESECLARACKGEGQVVSTGGGIVTDEGNRTLMSDSGAVVCLEARPEVIHSRLSSEEDKQRGPVIRPMLASANPLSRIADLKEQRQSAYALASWTVHTDELSPEEAAEEVVRGWRTLSRRGHPENRDDTERAATVRTTSGDYPIWVGWDILSGLGDRVAQMLHPGAAYLVTDEGAVRHAHRAQASMETAGVPSHLFVLPAGERSKSLDTAGRLYGWLAGRRAERGHLLLAVGGGMVGDLAGFVAATYLRGIHFGQAPTTLLAMMDAAIGGKTAVDLAHGKNLVGAFYQPSFVLSDVQTLQTLPERERASGWAEAIKHGLIRDESLLRTLEQKRDAVLAVDRKATTDAVARSASIKADVVSRDERETLGLRVILNYGHTIGHALEAATGYGRYLHGEAVSIGMMGAAGISHALGMMSGSEVDRQRAVLKAYSLPLTWSDVDPAALEASMRVDKKVEHGTIQWVLLNGIGHPVTRSDVPAGLVRDVLDSLGE